jgi:DNA-directed RNA polymerase beta' subunit
MLIFKSHATQLSKLLEIPLKKLEDIIYFRVYVVLDNGLSNCVKKKTVLSKKIDTVLISSLLDEIITKSDEKSSVVKQAQGLKNKINGQAEEDMAFLEDYLDFVTQHQKIKIGTGSEALRILLQEIDLEKELSKAREQKKTERIRFLRALIRNKIQLE